MVDAGRTALVADVKCTLGVRATNAGMTMAEYQISGTKETRGDSAGGTDGASKQQSNSRRYVFTAWGDQVDRELCARALALAPQKTPIAGRTGVSTVRWQIVDRTDQGELICNRLHDDECVWPWAVGDA